MRMSRRRFARRLLGSGVALLAVGCSPSPPPPNHAVSTAPAPEVIGRAPSQTPSPPAAGAATGASPPATSVAALVAAGSPGATASSPGQDRRLTIALGQWGSGSPFGWRAILSEQSLWGQVFDPLLQQDPRTAEYRPGLAVAWQPAPDYRSWTFTLRQGVQFHDGYGELTSDDVKFSLDQNLRPDATGLAVPFFNSHVDRIEAPDRYTVVVRLKSPTWEVPAHLAEWRGVQTIWSRKYLEQVGEERAALHPIGTGPYRHVDGKAGEFQRFEALTSHWRVVPHFGELVIRRITSPAMALEAVRAGEIDVTLLGGDLIRQARQANLRLHIKGSISQYWATLPGQAPPGTPDFNPGLPWVGDADDPASAERARLVRLALNHAVDKRAIVQEVWNGYGQVTPFSYWYYPMHQGFRYEWTVPEYDPQRARALLAETGYPDGFEIVVSGVPQTPDGPHAMEAIARDWENVGITISRRDLDNGAHASRLRSRNGVDYSWVYAVPQPYDEPSLYYGQAAGTLLVESPAYEQALRVIRGELDPVRRAHLTSDVGQRLYERYHGVMLGTKSHVWALSRRVGEWPLGVPSFYVYDPENIT
jgi:peptide/nickel transport system substrate-binding protein